MHIMSVFKTPFGKVDRASRAANTPRQIIDQKK